MSDEVEVCQFCNMPKDPECECLEIEICPICEYPQDECECGSEESEI